MNRRDFLSSLAITGAAGMFLPGQNAQAIQDPMFRKIIDGEKLPPCRCITRGPKFHWGAYYDQIHFDPTNRYVIAGEVDFQKRLPKRDDAINVGLVDTAANDKWIPFGTSKAWSWQLGCMLQWIPGVSTEVVWNDRVDDHYIARGYDYKSGKYRELDGPVYALSPDGRWSISPDFSRMFLGRPAYGCGGVADKQPGIPAPKDTGMYRVDLQTGKQKMLFSFADVVSIPEPEGFPEGTVHWFNHIMVSPDSKRFYFLHRWLLEPLKSGVLPGIFPGGPGRHTRLVTANIDGSDLKVLNHAPMASHLVWYDANRIIAWASRPSHGNNMYMFDVNTQKAEVCKDIFSGDPHLTLVPGTNGRWVLCDTRAKGDNDNWLQTVYLCNMETGKRVAIGRFTSPLDFTYAWRIDLHPNCSRDGKKVLLDTAVDGDRQMYIIDIDGICD